MEYDLLLKQIDAILEGETDLICAMANVSAAVYYGVPELNWAGFYRVVDGELLLGPFQGKVACARIKRGRGVCGTALAEGKSQLVPDVHRFPGHIACDSASNSEIVVPIFDSCGKIRAVLDVDSPILNRLTEMELALFEAIADKLRQSPALCSEP